MDGAATRDWKTCQACGLTHARTDCPRCGGQGLGTKSPVIIDPPSTSMSSGGGGRALGYIVVGAIFLVGFGVAGRLSIGGSYFLIKGMVLALVGVGGAIAKRA